MCHSRPIDGDCNRLIDVPGKRCLSKPPESTVQKARLRVRINNGRRWNTANNVIL